MDANRRPLGALLLAAACLVSYANGLTGDYTYDDKAIVRDNARLRAPGSVSEIWTTPYFGGPKGQGTGYRPILLLSYAVQWWIHGDRVAAFHVVNLLLHVLATLLLFAVLKRARFPEPVSLGAALLFAVHPIHVEAVTSLVGRGELLAAVFVFAFLLLALRGEPPSAEPAGAGTVLAALVLYALGVLTKESAAVAPALAFLFCARAAEGGVGRRVVAALRRGWPLYAGCAVVLAGSLLLRRAVLGGALKSPAFRIFEVENPLAPLPASERAANAGAILFRYLGRILFPARLSADESAWSIPVARGLDPVAVVAAVLLVGLIVASVARLRSARSDLAFGFLLFAVAFAPTANVLFPTGTIFAERLAYLPSAGIALAVASVVLRGPAETSGFPAAPPTRARLLAFGTIGILLAARTITRNRVWADDFALFSNTVRTSPASAKAHYNFAWVSADRGDVDTAVEHYTVATRIYPKYFDAWAGRGVAEQRLGDLAAAERSFRESIRVSPAYENGFFRLGRVRETVGDLAGAERIYADGFARNPKSTPLAYRLAIVRTRLGRPGAEAEWRRAVALARGATPFRLGYAEFLLSKGRVADARRQAREVLRRRPLETGALRILARTSREGGRALAEALVLEKIYRTAPDPADRARLEEIARDDPSYAGRYATFGPGRTRVIPGRASPRAPRGGGAASAPRSP